MFVCRNSKFVYRVYRKCFTTYWVSHRDSNNQNQSTYFLVHILSKYLDYESNCEQPLQVLSRRFFFRSPRSNPLFDLILIVISLQNIRKFNLSCFKGPWRHPTQRWQNHVILLVQKVIVNIWRNTHYCTISHLYTYSLICGVFSMNRQSDL